MATFATNDDLTTLQTGFSNRSATQLTAARNGAYGQIVTALYEGGYSVATVTASPTAWPMLTLLEVRIAALDLLGGGSSSAADMSSVTNWQHWEAWVTSILSKLAAGGLALVDSSGTITAPPHSGNNAGIVSDERDPGVTLGSPETWKDPDALEVWTE